MTGLSAAQPLFSFLCFMTRQHQNIFCMTKQEQEQEQGSLFNNWQLVGHILTLSDCGDLHLSKSTDTEFGFGRVVIW